MADFSDFDDSIPSTPSFYEDEPFISPSPGDFENIDMDVDWDSDSPGNISFNTVGTAEDVSDVHHQSQSSSFSSAASSQPSSASSAPPSTLSSSSTSPVSAQHAESAQQQRAAQRIIFSLAALGQERRPSLSASRQPRHNQSTTHHHGHDHDHGRDHGHNHSHSQHRNQAGVQTQSQDERLRQLRNQRDVLLREVREARAARRDRRHIHQAQGQARPQQNAEVVLIDELFDMEVAQRPPQPSRSVPPQSQSHYSQQQQTVIDLTDEPDSPIQQARPFAMPRAPSYPQDRSHPLRNPRRQPSQNRRTPSFARSDGSILGANPDVIDLTVDSPDDQDLNRIPPPQNGIIPPVRRRDRDRRGIEARERAANPELSIFAHLHNFRRSFPAFDLPHIMAGLGARLNAQVDVDVQIIGQNNIIPPPNPLANNPVDFNYQANGFGGFGGRAPTPKPAFEPLPPPREGFTRESGSDVVVICPSCDEELKYNSEDKEDDPPAKKARTRKDREEHHFWALKACGHVFCKKCFDNRKNASLSGFRRDPSSHTKQAKFLCAVEDCDSEVSQKTAWVGIFM